MTKAKDISLLANAAHFEKNPVISPQFEVFESITGKKFFAIRHRRAPETIQAIFYFYKQTYDECLDMVKSLSDTDIIWEWSQYAFRIISFTFEIKAGKGGAAIGNYQFLLVVNAEVQPSSPTRGGARI